MRIVVLAIFVMTAGFSTGAHASIAKIYGLQRSEKQTGPELTSLKSAAPRIRVRVQKSLKDVLIAGTDLKRKFHLNNQVKKFKGRKSIKFKCQNLKKTAFFEKPVLLASLGSSTGLISLHKEKYKGLLHVVTSQDSDSCDVIHETGIETYISSLLAKEMNNKWPVEALKAQAVAARSYAIHKMRSRQVNREAGHETYYHLESSEKHQVGGNFFDANHNTQEAALDTAGYVLVNPQGKVSPVFFHAKCGGKTLRPEQVWQNRVAGYKSVHCPFCKDHGSRGFDKTIDLKRWMKFLKWSKRKGILRGLKDEDLKNKLKIVPDKIFSRNIRFYLGERVFVIKKSLLRRYFGRFIVPSNNFELTLQEAGPFKVSLRLKGEGLGHGVGMCQLGALDLADKGWDYKAILSHYFPGHQLKKIY